MELMLRRRILLPNNEIKTIGGITVYANNQYYPQNDGNGLIGATSASNEYFITGIFDTGNTIPKLYEIARWRSPLAVGGTARFFNDLESASVEYLTLMRTDVSPDVPNIVTINAPGRYVCISIAKYCAADFYMKIVDGAYICKGKNIV